MVYPSILTPPRTIDEGALRYVRCVRTARARFLDTNNVISALDQPTSFSTIQLYQAPIASALFHKASVLSNRGISTMSADPAGSVHSGSVDRSAQLLLLPMRFDGA